MKSTFIMINAVAGILSLLIALDIFFTTALSPAKIVSGGVALVVGAVCVWLAEQTLRSRALRILKHE